MHFQHSVRKLPNVWPSLSSGKGMKYVRKQEERRKFASVVRRVGPGDTVHQAPTVSNMSICTAARSPP